MVWTACPGSNQTGLGPLLTWQTSTRGLTQRYSLSSGEFFLAVTLGQPGSGEVVWTACLRSNQTGLGPLLTSNPKTSQSSPENGTVREDSLSVNSRGRESGIVLEMRQLSYSLARFLVQLRRQFSEKVKFFEEIKTVLESQVQESSSGWETVREVKLKSRVSQ